VNLKEYMNIFYSSSEEAAALVEDNLITNTNQAWDSFFSHIDESRKTEPGAWRTVFLQSSCPHYEGLLSMDDAEGEFTTPELLIQDSSGSTQWFHARLQAVAVSGESAVVIRINRAYKLEQINARQAQAQRIAHFGYWDWHVPSGNVTWSDEVYNIFGVTKENFTPDIEGVLSFSKEEDRGIGQELIQRSVDKRQPGLYEMRIFRPDGEERWYESNFEPIFNEDGSLEYIKGTAHDITRMKRAEQKTLEREEWLRTVLNSIGDAVVATDVEGKILQMNPSAEQLTGWSTAEAQGLAYSEVMRIVDADTGDAVDGPVRKVLSTGEIQYLSGNLTLISRNGKDFRIADSAAPILTRHGEMTGVVIVFRDISREIILREELRQSQKLEAIGRLAGGVAHDFNNMLGGIVGGAELLESFISENSEAMKYYGIIRNAARQAAELTSNLLSFSRKQIRSMGPVSFHECVHRTVSILKSTIDRRIKIEMNLEAQPDIVNGDSAQLQSALLNLGINASHAMKEGGTLYILTANVELDRMYCDSCPFELKPGNYLYIEVRDEGEGIDPKFLPYIFDPFFTTKEKGRGTGMGLSAVYGTVQEHKGTITAYSEPGNGTSFHIQLPLSESAAPEVRESEVPVKGEGHILLIDDEEVIRSTGRSMLERLGYTVTAADSPLEALGEFQKDTGRYDLVIIDMIMPVMNGKEFFYRLRDMDPHVRAIVASGFLKEDDIKEMKTDGLLGFIQKPFRLTDLSHAVHDALAAKS